MTYYKNNETRKHNITLDKSYDLKNDSFENSKFANMTDGKIALDDDLEIDPDK